MPAMSDRVSAGMSARAHHAAINGLGLYVMLMYGITYYSITTAASRIASDFGLPTSSVFGVITLALFTTAALAPRLGRLTDRVGAAMILLVGAVLRSLLLVAMALAPEPASFVVALLLIQILGQATEYDAAFAATVELAGETARSGMSQITLWGGLASTVFWPATAFLLQHMSWREMFLVYAATLLVVCTPIAALVCALPHMRREARDITREVHAAAPSTDERTGPAVPAFWLVAAAFAFGGIAYNLPSLMLPVLDGLGLGTSAVLVGMIFGPSQTAGRFFDMMLGTRIKATTVAAVAAAMVAVAFAILLVGGVWAGIAFAVLFGAGAGVGYVVRGSVILALYGPRGYAASLGRLSTVRLVITGVSPLALTLLLECFGAHMVIYACGVAALCSLACFTMIAAIVRRPAR